jgi:sugar lactone lactonase YvrE
MRWRAVLLALASILSACGYSAPVEPKAVPEPAGGGSSLPALDAKFLFVANSGNDTVSVYAPASTLPVRVIANGINVPIALAFDRHHNLYVANFGSSTVSVYAPGKTRPTATIAKGIDNPVALVVDTAGNLYVANDGTSLHQIFGWVSVYRQGSTTPVLRITTGMTSPVALALDSSENLYVANCEICRNSQVTVYEAGSGKLLRFIRKHVIWPAALAFDRAGELYVANFLANDRIGNVVAYDNFAWRRTTRKGIDAPKALAFDRAGDLYVANHGFNNYSYPLPPGSVTMYPPGTSVPARTIAQGVHQPDALAFDDAGNVYVANYGDESFAGSVTIYGTAQQPISTIRTGVSHPSALAFGPW